MPDAATGFAEAASFGGAAMLIAATALLLLGAYQMYVNRWVLPAAGGTAGRRRVMPRVEAALFVAQGLISAGAGAVLVMAPLSIWSGGLFILTLLTSAVALGVLQRGPDRRDTA